MSSPAFFCNLIAAALFFTLGFFALMALHEKHLRHKYLKREKITGFDVFWAVTPFFLCGFFFLRLMK